MLSDSPDLEPLQSRIRWLAAPTSADWLEQAIARPDLVLIDHAHCERKAAGVALQLMFRYPGDAELGASLSALAREELEHFEQVLALLQPRAMAASSARRCAARSRSGCSMPFWWPG
jgi:tRNA-(ms[2]io[6]A)-hydroxylase